MFKLLLPALLFSMLYAEDGCRQKREQLKGLEAEYETEQVGQVVSWLLLTKSTSSDKKRLKQKIEILKLEIQQCETAQTSPGAGQD